MWVFGYGSLMSDGWEAAHGCVRRCTGTLSGYRRAFNKASIRNWGTKAAPCPTLNLKAEPSASCVGVAFEFPADKSAAVSGYLARREGPGFSLTELKVRLQTGEEVGAVVPMYSGPNTLREMPAAEIVALIRNTAGTSGACSNYVRDVARQLVALGIDDPAVA